MPGQQMTEISNVSDRSHVIAVYSRRSEHGQMLIEASPSTLTRTN